MLTVFSRPPEAMLGQGGSGRQTLRLRLRDQAQRTHTPSTACGFALIQVKRNVAAFGGQIRKGFFDPRTNGMELYSALWEVTQLQMELDSTQAALAPVWLQDICTTMCVRQPGTLTQVQHQKAGPNSQFPLHASTFCSTTGAFECVIALDKENRCD